MLGFPPVAVAQGLKGGEALSTSRLYHRLDVRNATECPDALPIVFGNVPNPVGGGYLESMARLGGKSQ
jgi:hypothetical protein